MFMFVFFSVVYACACVNLTAGFCDPNAATCEECLKKSNGTACEWYAHLYYTRKDRCQNPGRLSETGRLTKFIMKLSESTVELKKLKPQSKQFIPFRAANVELVTNAPAEIPIVLNIPGNFTKKETLVLILKKDDRFEVEFTHPHDVCGTWKKARPHKLKLRRLQPNTKVNFTLKLTLKEGATIFGTEKLKLKVKGPNNAVVNIRVKKKQGCGCKTKFSSGLCSHEGDLSCGVCTCRKPYFGKRCENFPSDENISDPCINPNVRSTMKCSGRGRCKAGQCICRYSHYSGKYCQCDDLSCENHDRIMCGGHGLCKCGDCICEPGYTGVSCNCTTSITNCLDESGRICSDHGICSCGKCQCQPGWSGEACECDNPRSCPQGGR